MKSLLRFLALGYLLLGANVAFAETHLWSRCFGSTSFTLADGPTGFAVDAFGNVVVVGFFNGTANLGGSDLVSQGTQDMFLAKYTPSGTHIWSKRIGGTGSESARAIGLDNAGDIYVTGSFVGSSDFGSGFPLTSTLDGVDIFFAKYTAGGGYVVSVRIGGNGSDYAHSIAVDNSGYVLTGYFNDTVSFGGASLMSVGGADIFLARYNTFGAHQWSQRFGSTGTDTGNGVTLDQSGNVILIGQFNGTVNFGGGNLLSAGGHDIVLAKYNSAGTHQWSARFGSTGSDVGRSVAADFSGHLALTGTFNGTVNFGGSNLVAAGTDGFLARFAFNGVHLWSTSFGGSSFDGGEAVDVTPAGDVALTGHFSGTANFGGGNRTSAGLRDGFVAMYQSNGAHVFSRPAGGTGEDFGNVVKFDLYANVLAGGTLENSVDFGGGAHWSNGGDDGWIAKYTRAAAEPTIASITDIGNDQGRKVKVVFFAAGADNAHAGIPVTSYEAYRRDDPPPGALAASKRELLENDWTHVATVGAHADSDYGMDASTIGDSTVALGPYDSYFFVRATTSVPSLYYDSALASGHSLDNLAPGIPANFIYDTGNLEWDESTAEDFDFFTVYGSNTDSFGSATVVDYSVAPSIDVSGSPYVYYFVTATDFSGNEGKPARVNTLSGVDGTPKSYVLSVSNYPNPFNPRTTVSYTVPSRGVVSARVYDIRGTYVASLVQKEHGAGAYSVEWDGRGADGTSVGSGVYFARIEHNGATRSKKMVLLK